MKKQPTREKLLDITFDEVYIHSYTATLVDTILKKVMQYFLMFVIIVISIYGK